MRILGIDFGEKRIGLAVSDQHESVATPLATVERKSDLQAIDHIVAIIEEEGIGAIVVGEPRGPDGGRGSAAERVGSFARKLHAATGLSTRMTDETLTSREASSRLRGTRSGDGRLDALAAQILLQQALDEPAAASPLQSRSRRSAEDR